jgi:LysR family transcriptional activator of nhaA
LFGFPKYRPRVSWLNYHHLLYFWRVAKDGGLAAAGKNLHVSHSTLSTQIHQLEEQLGERLFTKAGRRLVLTELGHVVFRYAEEIFSLGRELVDAVKDRSSGQPLRLEVGVVDAVPKLVVRHLLQPALALPQPARLVCREAAYDRLLADLAVHSLDIVIADSPVPPGSNVRAYHHLLQESGVDFFGTPELVTKYKRGFPESLHGAPMLLPSENGSLRRALNLWFERHGVVPRVVAEFEDSALLQVFAADGLGLFAAPTLVRKALTRQYGLRWLGRVEGVKERYYAISVQRRLEHPAGVAISNAARQERTRKKAPLP